jgi:Tol biopolymer transport system component/DNA-binding winged helix-turn-helix (wHTH) protein
VATPPNAGQTWRFGVFEVDLRRLELRRSGIVVKLREQSFRILVYLLEHPGEIVTREELRRVLWPSDTYVDFDHSLNTAVMKLREALGDSTGAPLYIETIPKRGYRFVAPLSRNQDSAVGVGANDSGTSVSPRSDKSDENDLRKMPGTGNPLDSGTHPQPKIDEMFWRHALRLGEEPVQASAPAEIPVSKSIRIRPFTIIAAVIALMLLASIGTMLFQRSRANPSSVEGPGFSSSAFHIVPITSASGNAIFPAFSPDGREIAFIWDGPDRRRYDVYVQLVGADLPLRLTYSKSGQIGAPAWSPDGREIAFGRCDGENDGVYVVPALGGAERKLTTAACLYSLAGPLAWLANGKEMLMIDHCPPNGDFGVVLFSLATGEKTCLTKPDSLKGTASGLDFVLSPDGGLIAFTRVGASGCCNIYTIPVSGGAPHLLTAGTRTQCSGINDLGCGGLMWTQDGKSIVFVSSRSNLPSLWHVSAIDGSVERETAYPAIGNFSKDGRRLVYSEKSSGEPPAIWRTDLASMGGPVVGTRKLISSQYPEMDAQPSPDGSHIVWMSTRTGSEELWKSGANGENPRQFSHLERYSGTPRWSPDGKWVAFDSYGSAPSQIFIVDGEGRNLHSIGNGSAFSVVPSWSRDGKCIYFSSARTGSLQVWKHFLDTGGEVQVTQNGGFDAFESLDGQTVYFSKFDRAGIWSKPARGGSESVVVAKRPQIGFWGNWAVTERGIYFLDFEAEPKPSIDFYSFATRRVSSVLALEKKPVRLQASLSATADGKTLYYTQYDRESVIKMMEISQ